MFIFNLNFSVSMLKQLFIWLLIWGIGFFMCCAYVLLSICMSSLNSTIILVGVIIRSLLLIKITLSFSPDLLFLCTYFFVVTQVSYIAVFIFNRNTCSFLSMLFLPPLHCPVLSPSVQREFY